MSACTAPDGSHWALQAWQRALPNLGHAPTAAQAVWELRLSHWTGALPVLTIQMNWAYKRYDHLFGTLTYGGRSVYGFHSTPAGEPLDSFGRNIYLDTFDSAYGAGWKRENSFLTHKATGAFCYGFYPHGSSPAGNGRSYRATVEAGCHARRDVAGRRSGAVRPRARGRHERFDPRAGRQPVQTRLITPKGTGGSRS